MTVISKSGLVKLQTLMDTERTENDAKLRILEGKAQVAEKAITASIPSNDPILANLQQMMIIRQQQLNQEDRLTKLENERDENKEALLALPPPTVEAPTITERALIRQCVNTYAKAKGLEYKDVWKSLYIQVYYRLGINLRIRSKKSNPLDVIEKNHAMAEVYAIACEIFSLNKSIS